MQVAGRPQLYPGDGRPLSGNASAWAQTAYGVSLTALGLNLVGIGYVFYVLASRPLHSGLTPDVVAALVLGLAGVGVAQVGTVLRQHGRADFVGRQATVTSVRTSVARVVVDHVPYWVYVKEGVARGDHVPLASTELQGAPSVSTSCPSACRGLPPDRRPEPR